MPMIDIYAPKGLFKDPHALAQVAAKTVMTVEQVPPIRMFRENTAGFVHEIDPSAYSNVDGESDHVRVQVLTNQGALNRDQQLALTAQLTDLIADTAGDATLKDRTWVLLTEAEAGGWGLWGHAHTNEELVKEAQKRIANGEK